jgi:molecular chaperone HtpG
VTAESFRVDLRGIVGILSHHLYSSPRVYLRELLQNARDAVVAARALDLGPDIPDPIEIEVDPGSGTLTVRDRGIGLTEPEMREVLATIGASSKRDHLLASRRQFLGQFGIGLLSCFLIADRIEVRSRSARTPDAATWVWVGRSDGTFTIDTCDQPLSTAGTEVRLVARPDDREWVGPQRVRLLAERFVSLLDVPITVRIASQPPEPVSGRTPPWRLPTDEAETWCRRELGFYPLAVLPIDLAVSGVAGVAFLTDTPGQVGTHRGNSVWSRGMFVAADNTQLLPDWAYFARLAVETGDLSLTASRESLQEGDLLDTVRDRVGDQLRDGIEAFADRDPAGFGQFTHVHAKGLLAMATADEDMLRFVIAHLLWETSAGPMALPAALSRFSVVRYATTEADFATFRSLLAAQGSLLVNGSYVYGTQILSLASEQDDRARAMGRFDSGRFLDSMREPPGAAAFGERIAREAAVLLDRLGVEILVRTFEPDSVAVLHLPGVARADDPVDQDPWSEFVDESNGSSAPAGPRTVLNLASGTVQTLAAIEDPVLLGEALVGLHTVGVLAAGQPLDDDLRVLLNRSLQSLVLAASGRSVT